LISARISPRGTNSRILDAAEEGRFEMVLSGHLIEEVRTVLERPKFRRYIPVADIPRFLARLVSASSLVAETGEEDPRSFVDDPKDDYLVELALTARADLIVSGDRHLNDPPEELPVRVVRPAAFFEELEDEESRR
jgi:uncharacterized protein